MLHFLTGTWEDIKLHDAELAGHRVTLTVEDVIYETPSVAQRIAATEAWLATPRQTTAVVNDDSRQGIYGVDEDRG